MTRVLFLPNDLGGGFGHLGRCLALAAALERRGGRAVFALAGPHAPRVAAAGFDVHPLPCPRRTRGGGEAPAYLFVPDVSYQVVRDGFHGPAAVTRTLRALEEIVRRVGPRWIVGDGHLLAGILGRRCGLPVAQLAKSVVHPRPARLVWWEEPPLGLLPPDPRPVFNPLLARWRWEPIERAEELFTGDLHLLPSLPELDPLDPLPPGTHYTGALLRDEGREPPTPGWLEEPAAGRRTLFVTVGGAAGHAGSPRLIRLLAGAFDDPAWRVILSTGGLPPPEDMPPRERVRVVPWVPSAAVLRRSDLVIFHGGYTRLEVLAQGLPSLILPLHSEQEYYGRLVAAAGAAELLPVSDQPYRRVLRRWRGGRHWPASVPFSVHLRPDFTLRPEELRAAARRLLDDPGPRARAVELQARLARMGGTEAALELLERSFG